MKKKEVARKFFCFVALYTTSWMTRAPLRREHGPISLARSARSQTVATLPHLIFLNCLSTGLNPTPVANPTNTVNHTSAIYLVPPCKSRSQWKPPSICQQPQNACVRVPPHDVPIFWQMCCGCAHERTQSGEILNSVLQKKNLHWSCHRRLAKLYTFLLCYAMTTNMFRLT